jgi:hypothetical protein
MWRIRIKDIYIHTHIQMNNGYSDPVHVISQNSFMNSFIFRPDTIFQVADSQLLIHQQAHQIHP